MILPILFVYALTRTFWWLSVQPTPAQVWWFPGPFLFESVLKVLLWVVPCVLLLRYLRRDTWHDAWSELGLLHAPWHGIGLMVLVTMPMVALPATAVMTRVDLESVVAFCVLGPLAEEVLYRGFLFQQLWHRARWPVWAAALGSSVVFAMAHHRNLDERLVLGFLQDDLAVSLSTLGPPLLAAVAGGCLFAWITWRWRSLWPAIALHGAVNFWWDVSVRPHETAAAIAQTMALAAAVAVTVLRTRSSPPVAADADRTYS